MPTAVCARVKPCGFDGLPPRGERKVQTNNMHCALVSGLAKEEAFSREHHSVAVFLVFTGDLGPASSYPASLWSVKEVRIRENIGEAHRCSGFFLC